MSQLLEEKGECGGARSSTEQGEGQGRQAWKGPKQARSQKWKSEALITH